MLLGSIRVRRETLPGRKSMLKGHYTRLSNVGMNYTQAVRMIRISKRTGRAWRTDCNEKPSVDSYH